MTEYAKLQNGSDIRGVALPLAAQEPVNLTEEAVEQIARAFAVWLAQRTGRPAAERSLCLMAAGHHATEHIAMPWLAEQLRAALPGLAIEVFDSDPTCWGGADAEE